jgi:hypothetical protein
MWHYRDCIVSERELLANFRGIPIIWRQSMIKPITLLLTTLLAIGHIHNPVFAEDADESGDKTTATTTDTPPADDQKKKKVTNGDSEPECE